MRHRLVIARWKEDVAWARGYPHLVYDKGGGPLEADGLNVFPVSANPEGHESHSYLLHIILHYDDLDDWTTFVQGTPFDHAKEWGSQWCAEPAGGFAWVGHWMVADDQRGQPHHFHYIPVGLAYEKIFERPAPLAFEFCAGAQFVVSREKIRSYPLAFWEKVQALGFEPDFEFDWGYTMERLWGCLWNESL